MGKRASFKCVNCSNIWITTPDSIMSGHKCPYCAQKVPVNIKKIEAYINNNNLSYKIISKDVENNVQKINMQHILCGAIYETTPKAFMNSENRCPICASSKGEQSIYWSLIELVVDFQRQYSFADLKIERPLKFDFAILQDGGEKVSFLIECDGSTHVRKDSFGRTEDDFDKYNKRDIIKNSYAEKNNLVLYRFPYYEIESKNVEEIKRLVMIWLKNILQDKTEPSFVGTH